MRCDELQEMLGQEEPLGAEAAAHLEQCGRCRAAAVDLTAIQAAARSLGNEELEPPARVWETLRAQLQAEGLIHAPTDPAPAAGWLAGVFAAFHRPVFAGAVLSLLLVAAVFVGLRSVREKARLAESNEAVNAATAFGRQLAAVEQHTVSRVHQHNPEVVASFRQNLDIVDNMIAMCEKSVRENPQDEMARDYLYGAYQQKAELLSLMMDRDAMGD